VAGQPPPPAPPPLPEQPRTFADRLRGARWWVYVLLIIAALVILGIYLSLSSVTFSIQVTPRNDVGDFNAQTTNEGDKAAEAHCTIRALDRFNNRIGFDFFDLPEIQPGQTYPWNGHVQVDEAVAGFEGECEP
jgi:hypothetical protein